MTKMRYRSFWRARYGHLLVAREADLFARQKIIIDAAAADSGGMALRTLQFQLEVKAVGERLRALGVQRARPGRHRNDDCEPHYPL